MNKHTLTEAFAIYHRNPIRPFNQGDWNGFAGCDGEPYISEDDDYIAVLDVGTEEAVLQIFEMIVDEVNMTDFTLVTTYQLDWNAEVSA